MLELNIKDETYEFAFDYGFVKEVNNEFGMEAHGQKMRTGLQMMITTLVEMADSQTLVEVLLLANKGKKPRLKMAILNDYIYENGTKELLEDVTKELEASGFTSEAYKKATQMTEEARNQATEN